MSRVILGFDPIINKLADALGVPKYARDWSLHVTHDDAVTLDIHALAPSSGLTDEQIQALKSARLWVVARDPEVQEIIDELNDRKANAIKDVKLEVSNEQEG